MTAPDIDTRKGGISYVNPGSVLIYQGSYEADPDFFLQFLSNYYCNHTALDRVMYHGESLLIERIVMFEWDLVRWHNLGVIK